jgi:uncharacterized protein YjlB
LVLIEENGLMTSEHFWLARNGWVPNNPRLPVILYRRALPEGPAEETASRFESLFERHGWPPQWRDGVFDFHHYHSTAHEALGFAAGWARLILGGPQGREVRVSAGDAALLPVGTGHRRIERSADFWVVGAYPRGQDFDIRQSAPSSEALEAMAAVDFPNSDPVAGANGPSMRLWRRIASHRDPS